MATHTSVTAMNAPAAAALGENPNPSPADFEAQFFQRFTSRRSVVHSTKGIVSCTQPLAAAAGIKILEAGGNAAEAAVAVAAAMNVTEPMSCGIGGDLFTLYYDAKSGIVSAMNCSGRSPEALTREKALSDGLKDTGTIPMRSVHAVTVPGSAAGWVDVHERYGQGKLTLSDILAPAIKLAEEGYPVSEVAAAYWEKGKGLLEFASPNAAEMLKKDSKTGKPRAPRTGEVMKLPNMAKTFRLLAEKGKPGFYEGPIAKAIVQAVGDRGGVLSLEDLKKHGSENVDPISLEVEKDGLKVWECPPNGQGIVALMALGILEQLEKSKAICPLEEMEHNSAEYLHAVVEALRIAFADAAWFVTDPNVENVPTEQLLNKEYLARRASLFNPKGATKELDHGSPAFSSSDTVYFAVTDQWGNGCSFIMSNYAGFGSGIIPKGCGFTLQNRGANFNLEKDHPNVVKPNKRPYHTIIPGMITKEGHLHSVYGVMGGFMQPQGHVQVYLNMLRFKMDPQQALDAPRICIGGFTTSPDLFLEEGISESTCKQLMDMGHTGASIVKGLERSVFGRGQVIRLHYDDEGTRVYSAGSDPRADGQAVPMI